MTLVTSARKPSRPRRGRPPGTEERDHLRTLKLTLAYDGTRFVGWQRQARGTSVQGLLEEAVGRIENAAVVVTGSGRTDAGVHALGQVASVRIAHSIDSASLRRALNATLPGDVRVLEVEEVHPGFDARFSARRKTYRYRIDARPVASPFERLYAWHVPQPIDRERLSGGLARIVGRHDFAAFQSSGTDVRSTTRTMFAAHLAPALAAHGPSGDDRLIALDFTADGFLRHMVRALVGTVVEVGLGRREPEDLTRLLAGAPRGSAGPTAPPHGLFLLEVRYDESRSGA